jgi:hypothetical protein
MDELDEEDEVEKYIANHLSIQENNAMGASRSWFNCDKFRKMLRDPEANEMANRILDYFEDCDISPKETYLESCIDDKDDVEFACYYVEYPLLSYGWYILKRKHNKLWSITNFWWQEAGKGQHGKHGKGRVRSREEFEAEYVS